MQENSPENAPDPSATSSDEKLNQSAPPETQVSADAEVKKEIDLNAIYPEEEKDLNNLFPEEEMRVLLKKINKNRKDIAVMNERFEDELQIGETTPDPS